MRYMLLLLLLPLLMTGCKPQADSPAPSATAQATSPGHEIFLNNCLMCHQGPGDPPGPNGVIKQSPQLSDAKTFEAFLREPNRGMMPAFPDTLLPSEEVEVLYEYLKQEQGQ